MKMRASNEAPARRSRSRRLLAWLNRRLGRPTRRTCVGCGQVQPGSWCRPCWNDRPRAEPPIAA